MTNMKALVEGAGENMNWWFIKIHKAKDPLLDR
jgi:hypothetical protein